MLHLKKTEWIVLKCIVGHGIRGAGTTEIKEETGLDRSTVFRTCDKLIQKNILLKKNKMAKYQLTGKIYGEPTLLPFSLGMDAISDMLSWKNISVNNTFCNTQLCKKVMAKLNSRGKTKLTSSEQRQYDELILFEFANRIGALFLYFLITAMSPKKLNLDIEEMKKEIEFEDSDEMAMKWIDNAIKPARVLQEFANIPLVTAGLAPVESLKKSIYILDEPTFSKLMTAFKNIYGDIFDNLGRIRKKAQENIELFRYPKPKSKV